MPSCLMRAAITQPKPAGVIGRKGVFSLKNNSRYGDRGRTCLEVSENRLADLSR